MALHKQIEQVLETQVRPLLRSHGGDVRLIGCTADGVVTVELMGACAGCPSADLGTRDMIDAVLKHALPVVTAVELMQPVSDELLAFARKLLSHEEAR